MIIARRSITNVSFGTDPVAQSLRSVIGAPASRPSSTSAAAPSPGAPLDLAALYPAVFAPVARTPFTTRPVRAVAVRLSMLGTAAAAAFAMFHR